MLTKFIPLSLQQYTCNIFNIVKLYVKTEMQLKTIFDTISDTCEEILKTSSYLLYIKLDLHRVWKYPTNIINAKDSKYG